MDRTPVSFRGRQLGKYAKAWELKKRISLIKLLNSTESLAPTGFSIELGNNNTNQ